MPPAKKGASSSRPKAPPARNAAKRPNKPGLAMSIESPDRTLSSFSGFEKGALPTSFSLKPRQDNNVFPKSFSKGKGKEQDDANVHDLWSDKFRPNSKTKLAIHNQKVADVENWLQEALYGKLSVQKYRRLLVLSGPAGCGKSTLVRLLAQANELNFDIVEWNEETRQGMGEPAAWDRGRFSAFDHDSFHSLNNTQTRFAHFVSQSKKFSGLHLRSEDDEEADTNDMKSDSVSHKGQSSSHKPSSHKPRLIFLDDLPNLQYEPTRAAFHSALVDFISTSSASDGTSYPPMIIVLSDNTPRSGEWDASYRTQSWKERSEETMNVRSVIPESVQNHPGFQQITFNAVARTILRKTLQAVLASERVHNPKWIPAPSSDKAKKLVEAIIDVSNGDVRSALNSMQMALLQPREGLEEQRGTKRRFDGGRVKSNDAMASLAGLATGREASLATFHTLGKILYNKREGDPEKKSKANEDSETDSDDDEVFEEAREEKWLRDAIRSFAGTSSERFKLPEHLKHLQRRKSRVDCEHIWRTMPMDAGTLQVFLHQHYTPFCNDVDEAAKVMDNLSFAEALKPDHEEWLHGSLTTYYNFLVSAHGTLMSLPSPVPRNSEQRFRGMAFFDFLRRARKNLDTLSSFTSAMTMTAPSLNESPLQHHKSVLHEASAEQLASEILPMMALCGRLPNDVRSACMLNAKQDFAILPSSSAAAAQDVHYGGAWGKEDEEADMEDTALALAGTDTDKTTSLYDESGQRLKVELLDHSMRSQPPLPITMSVAHDKDAFEVDSNDEKAEEIDDFD